MSTEIYLFVDKLKKFSKDIYKNNNIEELNKELISINEMYDELIKNVKINNLAKDYILSKFIRLNEVDMHIIPLIVNISVVIEKKYKTFYCMEENNNDGPI